MELDNELIKKITIKPLLETLKLEKIDDETYFSEKYKNYVSNSRLGLLKTKGAKAFFEGIKSDYNPSFAFGSNLHALVLQPELFELIDTVFKPTAKAGLMADYLYNEEGFTPSDDKIKAASYEIGYYKDKLTSNRLKEFREKAEPYWKDRFLYEQKNPIGNKTRIYTDEKSVFTLKSCLKSIEDNKEFSKLLYPEGVLEDIHVYNEVTILLDVEISIPGYDSKIYKLKAKLDNFTIDEEGNTITVNDLKTTSRFAKEFDPTYYSYQREIGFYSMLLKLCSERFFNLINPIIKGNFLVVSTIPEYNTLVYPMTNKLYKSGINEITFLLKTMAYLNIVKKYEFQ